MEPYSPTGKRTVPYEGPLDARVMAVAESPAGRELELGRPLVGRSGKLWDGVLNAAAVPRPEIRVVNVVPCRAPQDRFALHAVEDKVWGAALFKRELDRALQNGLELIVPMGDNPLRMVANALPYAPRWHGDDDGGQQGEAERSRIGIWRGSLFQLNDPPVDVQSYLRNLVPGPGPYVLPTYHPAVYTRRYDWHHWGITDWKKVRAWLSGQWKWPKNRTWFFNRYDLLPNLVRHIIEHERVVAVDTESSPYRIVGLATQHECHVFAYEHEYCFEPLRDLLTSMAVRKVAQNSGHDWTWFHLEGIDTVLPHADVGGGHHVVHGGAIQKTLSPAISTKWTTYPYHKWLVDFDPKLYCGFDTVVAFDAEEPIRERVVARGLRDIYNHDHRLLMELLRMQWYGVAVDEEARASAVVSLRAEYERRTQAYVRLAEPVVRAQLATYAQTLKPSTTRFAKPHLFYLTKQCTCCNGAKRCASCAGLRAVPKRKADYAGMRANGLGVITEERLSEFTVSALKELMPACRRCGGEGKRGEWQELNPDSPDQLRDVLYKGFGVKERKMKGRTTVRASQLNALLEGGKLRAEQDAVVRTVVEFSQTASDLTTMERLQPDVDGLLHCVFDPWGTVSGRVASKEGLMQKGTNLQNIPVKHRGVVVPKSHELFVAPDYSSIEARNVAVVSQDAGMIAAFKEPVDRPGHPYHGKVDAHTRLQLAVMDIGRFELTRDQCKILGFGGMYGGGGEQLAKEMTAKAFTQNVGRPVSDEDGAMLQRLMLQRVWPGLGKWHRETEDVLRRTRELRSPTGRIRRWPGYVVDTRTKRLNSKVLKEGLSFKPQDMGAFVLALGLFAIMDSLRGLVRIVHPSIHVHDELVMGVPATPGRLQDEALVGIREAMEMEVWGMWYPIGELELLNNWKEAKG